MSPLGAWPLRAVWLLLPLAAGPALADALHPTAGSFRTVASVGLWGLWAATLVALLVPRSVTLTAVRVMAPSAMVAVVWAALAGPVDDSVAALAATSAALAAASAFTPAVGELFANGSSYGDERRLPLRVPAPLLLGPLALAWVVAVAGAVAGPLLLAAEMWAPGGLALVAGWPLAALAVRALHGLARRWVVFVPAGLVLHDPLVLLDPQLFPRRTITRLGPAPADTDALDLTRGALGLALQLDAVEPVTLTVAGAGRRAAGAAIEVDRLLFTPTRPGVLLAEARARRIAVG